MIRFLFQTFQFVLTCDNEWKNTFVGTLTMIGMMVGSFFLGPLADM